MPWRPKPSKVCLSSWDSDSKLPFLQTWVLPPPGGSKTSRDVFASAGFVAGCGSGACRRALAAPAIPGDDKRSSDTKTGVCTYHNPYHQGKGESTKHLAAHQEQDEHGKESQTAGQDRSRKSLVDGLVDHVSERFLAQQTVVLTDTIKDDDRVVHGITDQSKQGRDNRQRNLEMQQREKSQSNEHVMENGQNGRGPVNPLESEGNIYQHAAQSIEGNENRLLAKLGADLGADDFDVANGEGPESIVTFYSGEDRSSDTVHFGEVIKIGEHAVGVSVAIVEKFFCKLLVAIGGGDGKNQGIFFRKERGKRGGRRGIEIGFVRPRDSVGGVQSAEDFLPAGLESRLILSLAFDEDNDFVRIGIGDVADTLNLGVAKPLGGKPGAELINRSEEHT